VALAPLPHTPGNVEELSAQIATLIADAGLRARLSSAARRTAEEKFELGRLARELVPVYQSAVNGAARIQNSEFRIQNS
jgi:glycosyltransferase involved in cell wall biosynthesis